MLGMGLSLKLEDFKRVVLFPKAVAVGLFSQLILLPVLAYCLILVFGLGTEMAVGIMILSACPGGATSNLISHLAKGDTALSITLTAISSLATVISIPLIVNFAILEFMPNGQEQQLDVIKTVLAVLVITITPVSLGMFIHSRLEGFARKMEKPVKVLSALLLALIIMAAVLKEKEHIVEYFSLAGPVALSLNLLMLLIGFYGSRLLRLNSAQSITISVETGIQNGTLGITIAATLIGNSMMTIPSAIYSLIMFVSAAVLIFLGNRKSVYSRQTA